MARETRVNLRPRPRESVRQAIERLGDEVGLDGLREQPMAMTFAEFVDAVVKGRAVR